MIIAESDAAHDARRVTYNCSVVVDKAMACESKSTVQHRPPARRNKLIPADCTSPVDY